MPCNAVDAGLDDANQPGQFMVLKNEFDTEMPADHGLNPVALSGGARYALPAAVLFQAGARFRFATSRAACLAANGTHSVPLRRRSNGNRLATYVLCFV